MAHPASRFSGRLRRKSPSPTATFLGLLVCFAFGSVGAVITATVAAGEVHAHRSQSFTPVPAQIVSVSRFGKRFAVWFEYSYAGTTYSSDQVWAAGNWISGDVGPSRVHGLSAGTVTTAYVDPESPVHACLFRDQSSEGRVIAGMGLACLGLLVLCLLDFSSRAIGVIRGKRSMLRESFRAGEVRLIPSIQLVMPRLPSALFPGWLIIALAWMFGASVSLFPLTSVAVFVLWGVALAVFAVPWTIAMLRIHTGGLSIAVDTRRGIARFPSNVGIPEIALDRIRRVRIRATAMPVLPLLPPVSATEVLVSVNVDGQWREHTVFRTFAESCTAFGKNADLEIRDTMAAVLLPNRHSSRARASDRVDG